MNKAIAKKNKKSNIMFEVPVKKTFNTIMTTLVCVITAMVFIVSMLMYSSSMGYLNNVEKDKEKPMISSIVYSIMELDNIEGVKINVEGKSLDSYPNSGERMPSILDKSIGINERVNITSRNNIQKVVVYYLEDIDDNIYYIRTERD